MIFLVDLEALEKRYTSQWRKWFCDWFENNNYRYELVSGIDREFKQGEFLDICRTNLYKSEQVGHIARLFDEKKVKHNDVFYFFDGWHYGITATKYMADLLGFKIKIVSYWHAGSYDPYDFITQKGLRNWASPGELSWMLACDKILVATQFHKDLILKGFPNWGSYDLDYKIHVVGFPYNTEDLKIYKSAYSEYKKNIVVFPHRISSEKQPEVFDKLAEKFKGRAYKFIKATEVTDTKKEYFELLAKSKVVFSANLQETFGIGTMEAVMLGCLPIVPDRLCYPELYDKKFLYDKGTDLSSMIVDFIPNYKKHTNSNEYINTIEKLKEVTNIDRILQEVII